MDGHPIAEDFVDGATYLLPEGHQRNLMISYCSTGVEGQNRTSDTGIFRPKLRKLKIVVITGS